MQPLLSGKQLKPMAGPCADRHPPQHVCMQDGKEAIEGYVDVLMILPRSFLYMQHMLTPSTCSWMPTLLCATQASCLPCWTTLARSCCLVTRSRPR